MISEAHVFMRSELKRHLFIPLQTLNVAGNKIRDLDHVFPVSKLPILESLNLQGNPVSTVVDYRLKVFESFGKR